MFGFTNDIFEIHKVTFEIYVEDKLINRQSMQAPKEMLMANFIQTMQQMIEDRRPLKMRMLSPEVIWDNFENRQKVLNNEVIFSNNAMITWEENRQKE